MPWAADNRVSTSPIEGGIEITEAEYQAALEGMASGRIVSIEGGVFAVIDPPEPEPEPEPEPQPPTVWDVVAERERRLGLGFDYDFGGVRGIHRIAMTEHDMKGWDEITEWSLAAIALGTPNATIDVLTETGPCTVTAQEWQQVLMAATAARQPIWAASFALQAMDPIPADYADDEWWA